MRQAGRVRAWLPLLALMLVALALRWPFVPFAAHTGDARNFAEWARVIDQRGLFHFYEPENRYHVIDRTYPPFSTLIFAGLLRVYGGPPLLMPPGNILDPPEAAFVALLKVVPIAADLALMAIAYAWLAGRGARRVFVPLAVVFYPVFVIMSGWWGQYDLPFALCIVLSLMALGRGRVVPAWLLTGAALLFKPHAVFAVPVLLVLTFRRHGLRRTVIAVAACGALGAAVYAPFFLASGDDVFSTYTQAGGVFPFLTNNAYNLWYALASIHKGAPVRFMEYPDSGIALLGLSFGHVGLLLFAAFTLTLLAVVWRRFRERQEFLWVGAQFFGFFMLLTEMHDRYIFAAVVLLLFAVAQRPAAWVPALGTAVTSSVNLLTVITGFQYEWSPYVALANVALFVLTLGLVLVPVRFPPELPLDAEILTRRL